MVLFRILMEVLLYISLQVETTLKIDDYGNLIKRTRLAITVSIFDNIGPEFWEKRQNILREG